MQHFGAIGGYVIWATSKLYKGSTTILRIQNHTHDTINKVMHSKVQLATSN